MTPDEITLKRIELLHPILRTEVKEIYQKLFDQKIYIRITQGYRTFKEQDEIYAQGRTKPGKIVTWAKGGDSYHCYGLAVDFCLLKKNGEVIWDLETDLNNDGKKDWMQVVDIFDKYRWIWGGSWVLHKDYPHFQKTFGKSINELKYLLSEGKVTNGYVNLE